MSTPGTVNYPTSVDDAVSLLNAANGSTTTLSASLAIAATTASVASTALFPSSGAISINQEIIYYTGVTATSFTGLIRGREGTADALHATANAVEGRIVARHHLVLAEAIIATQTKLDSHTHAFSAITSKPTTLAGYGITDAFTQAAADALYSVLGHTHAASALTGISPAETPAKMPVAVGIESHASGARMAPDVSGYVRGKSCEYCLPGPISGYGSTPWSNSLAESHG